MRTMLVLLLFFGMSCLLLTSNGRSLLKSAKRFVEAQLQQAKEYLGRITFQVTVTINAAQNRRSSAVAAQVRAGKTRTKMSHC
jgi:hypothetical protein